MPNDQPHIVVVDDHKDIREPLAEYLKNHGYRVSVAEDGKQLSQVLKTSNVSLIILDILMPGENGLDVCRRVRETLDIPVILLTALVEDTDKIIGLEIGADDYITKPFNPRELLARVKVVLRRSNKLPRQFSVLESGLMVFGHWQLDVDRQVLMSTLSEQDNIQLSTSEFRLLSTFLGHPKMVLSREQLLDLVSNRASDVFDRSVDNQVSRLRKKIELNPKEPEIIKTVWGGGYMLTVDVVHT